jgi:hypothetical protein
MSEEFTTPDLVKLTRLWLDGDSWRPYAARAQALGLRSEVRAYF